MKKRSVETSFSLISSFPKESFLFVLTFFFLWPTLRLRGLKLIKAVRKISAGMLSKGTQCGPGSVPAMVRIKDSIGAQDMPGNKWGPLHYREEKYGWAEVLITPPRHMCINKTTTSKPWVATNSIEENLTSTGAGKVSRGTGLPKPLFIFWSWRKKKNRGAAEDGINQYRGRHH